MCKYIILRSICEFNLVMTKLNIAMTRLVIQGLLHADKGILGKKDFKKLPELQISFSDSVEEILPTGLNNR